MGGSRANGGLVKDFQIDLLSRTDYAFNLRVNTADSNSNHIIWRSFWIAGGHSIVTEVGSDVTYLAFQPSKHVLNFNFIFSFRFLKIFPTMKRNLLFLLMTSNHSFNFLANASPANLHTRPCFRI